MFFNDVFNSNEEIKLFLVLQTLLCFRGSHAEQVGNTQLVFISSIIYINIECARQTQSSSVEL